MGETVENSTTENDSVENSTDTDPNILKKEALIEAMHKSLGVVTTACKASGVSRVAYYQYCKDDPDFKKRCFDVQEIALDFAESKLMKKISEEELTAIIFFLKCKGKKRGFIEGQVNFNTELNDEDKQVMNIGGKAIVF